MTDQEMKQTVYVVDDDPEVGEVLHWLIESIGVNVETYVSAEDFLNAYTGNPGCLVLDVRMKGTSGLKLQETLLAKGDNIPIIFLTGHGDIPMTVRAMKLGAVEFLTKPFNNQILLDAIQQALEKNAKQQHEQAASEDAAQRAESLTGREREVMEGMVSGKLSKTIAYDLGIGLSTVEAHRAKVMKKMGVRTLAELVSLVLKNNLVDVAERA